MLSVSLCVHSILCHRAQLISHWGQSGVKEPLAISGCKGFEVPPGLLLSHYQNPSGLLMIYLKVLTINLHKYERREKKYLVIKTINKRLSTEKEKMIGEKRGDKKFLKRFFI